MTTTRPEDDAGPPVAALVLGRREDPPRFWWFPFGQRGLRAMAAATAFAAVLVAGWLVVRTPQRLGPVDVEETTTGVGPVGERMTMFVGNFEPHGPDLVHIRSVRLTDVPRGIRIIGIWGLEGGPPGGYNHGDPDPDVQARLRPVTDMVLDPKTPSDKREAWGLVVVLEAVEVGEWTTTGIDVSWRAGRHQGTTHYDYRLGIEVEPGPSSTPTGAP